MTKYRNILYLLVCLLAVGHVHAAGTDSGDPVTNSVSLTYTVNSVSQTVNTDVEFTVDTKYQLAVTTPNSDWIEALPGQSGATASAISFTVTNNSNIDTPVMIALMDQDATQVDGFTVFSGTPSSFTPTALTIWEDTNSNGLLDGGETSLGTALGAYELSSDLVQDASITISVRVDIDGGDAGDLYKAYTLVAAIGDGAGDALFNDDSGNISPGGTANNVANGKDTVESVFADNAVPSPGGEDEGFNFNSAAGTGVDDADFDGQVSNTSGFVTRFGLGIAKQVEVIWDPVTGNRYDGSGVAIVGANPKAIPGAIMLYVIGVSSDAGFDATAVSIDDDIPDGLVDAGNTTTEPAANINMPATVNITINGSPTAFTIDGGVSANGEYHIQDCAGGALVSTTFAGTDPEVSGASLGACDAGDTGYVAYVVTVQ